MSLDFETADSRGASTEYYRPDFRILSAAVSWRSESGDLHSLFLEGEPEVNTLVSFLSLNQTKVVVHNLQFEYGVVHHRLPGLNINYHADTARLTQLWDNGGRRDEAEEASYEEDDAPPVKVANVGLSLVACVSRVLDPIHHDHKKPYHDKLVSEFRIKKSDLGKSLHLLSKEDLAAYNMADSEVTLRLYEELTSRFTSTSFDWTLDHEIYAASCYMTSDARSKGVLVDLNKARESLDLFNKEYWAMEFSFRERFQKEIEELENETLEATLALLKTDKGREKAKARMLANPDTYRFKISSTKQKQMLFCDKLGMKAKFFTESGAPSFKRSLLGQWGSGGLILKKRGSIKVAAAQCETLIEKASYDNRWHIDIMTAGTNTGRMKGAGGLNIQGMSRREKRLMSTLVADPGHVFVSIDLNAGEPTITTEFSKDPYYRMATFDMVGKEPYYDKNGVLCIDDIYLMGMSVSPMGHVKIRDAFDNMKFDGMSFSQAWLVNPDLIKTHLKEDRAFHKILILGIGYSMGPAHMVESAEAAGYDLTIEDARDFFNSYWELFKGVKRLGKNLEAQYAQDKYLVNPFGYRLVPDKEYKCLNYFIQSSVSGLINVVCAKFFGICKDATPVTIIHDELICQIPENKEEECKALFQKALDSLNEDLGWSVRIRTGWKVGKDLYEAK